MTKEEIKERIEAYEEIINDPSEDQTTKDFAKKKVAKLKDQLVPGYGALSSEEEEVEEVEEVEDVEEVVEDKPKKAPKKKKTTKKKGRGRPKKRGRPAKRKTTKKTPTVKAKAKKMSKDLGLSIKECEELLEKYSKEDKARKERVAKRKKAGKSAELTVTESLEKEVKTVKNKVEDKKTPTTKAQAKSQGSKITDLVKAILEGIDKKKDKITQIDAIIKGLVAEKKKIMSQKGTGSFLVGSMLGGYAGYKLGAIQEQTELKDLFKGEKKLAKDFKDAVKDKQKKDETYTEFEEMYAKGGKLRLINDTETDLLTARDELYGLGDDDFVEMQEKKSGNNWNEDIASYDDTFEAYDDLYVTFINRLEQKYGYTIGYDGDYAKGGILGKKSIDNLTKEEWVKYVKEAIKKYNLKEEIKDYDYVVDYYKKGMDDEGNEWSFHYGDESDEDGLWDASNTIIRQQDKEYEDFPGESPDQGLVYYGLKELTWQQMTKKERERADKEGKDDYAKGGKITNADGETLTKEEWIKEWEEWQEKSYGSEYYDVPKLVEHYDMQGELVEQVKNDLEISRSQAEELAEMIYEKHSEGGTKFKKGGYTANVEEASFKIDKWLMIDERDEETMNVWFNAIDDGDHEQIKSMIEDFGDDERLSFYGIKSDKDVEELSKYLVDSSYAKGGKIPYNDKEHKEIVRKFLMKQPKRYVDNIMDIEDLDKDFPNPFFNSEAEYDKASKKELVDIIVDKDYGAEFVYNDMFGIPMYEGYAKGGKTPKFKVRKSFYDKIIGANKKTGTGEDMRVVYHLRDDDKGYSQNFLMKKMTAEELADTDPSGFEVEEEVYVDYTDKDGNKKKRYLVENSSDSVVRTLRDKYNAVSIEDITMEWEVEDKGRDYADYSDYDSL